MDLMTIISTIGSGGLTGVIGSGITAYSEYKNKQMDLDHIASMKRLDLEALDKEIARDVRISETEAETERWKSQDDLMEASYLSAELDTRNAGSNWFWVLIEGWRRAIRPLATTYAMVILTVLTIAIYDLYNSHGLSPDVQYVNDLLEHLIFMSIYLATTIILWWFGTRKAKATLLQ